MTNLELELLRHGWTRPDEARIKRDRATQRALRLASSRILMRAATWLANLAERIAMDKVPEPV